MSRKLFQLLLITASLTVVGCGGSLQQTRFGIEDETEANTIERANNIVLLRNRSEFDRVEKILALDLSRFKSDPYALLRIRHEMADIYSHHLMDIEKAIELDEAILASPDADLKTRFALQHTVASNRILTEKDYAENYLNVSSLVIKQIAKTRLAGNVKLANGEPISYEKNYGKDFLLQHLNDTYADISKTHQNTSDRVKLVSRLIRAEYELYRLTSDNKYINKGYNFILNREVSIESIDLTEIDFLSFSKYLQLAFEISRKTELAEASLQVVYKPYIKLRNPTYRWLYNKLVNDYINVLIEVNLSNENYVDMLYYASLNKSRMILEDRANNLLDGKFNLASVNSKDSTEASSGFPSKAVFGRKLRLANNYLDIYVVGKYKTVKINSIEHANAKLDTTHAISSTRAVGVMRKINTDEILTTNKLIVSYIKNGKVVSVEQKSMAEAIKLQTEYDLLYDKVSGGSEEKRGVGVIGNKYQSAINFAVKNPLFSGKLDDDLAVSPDKWVSKFPFSYLFGKRTTRSLNLFSLAEPTDLRDIKLVGYFNPLIDHPKGPLPGAEAEASIIKQIIPNAEIHLRGDASLKVINQPSTRNIVHLSMHGMNNPEEPNYSKLLFSGSSFDGSTTDINALYAKDMLNVSQLKGNELVFTAACETGLTRGSSNNSSELLGILRPLLINDNKNIILTLWEVNDVSTRDFVKFFYQNLVRDKNVKISFYKAVDELRKKYPDPNHWAAFYLIQNG